MAFVESSIVSIIVVNTEHKYNILKFSLLILMEEVHSLHVAVGIHSPVPVFANMVVMRCGRKAEHTQETHASTSLAAVGLDRRQIGLCMNSQSTFK